VFHADALGVSLGLACGATGLMLSGRHDSTGQPELKAAAVRVTRLRGVILPIGAGPKPSSASFSDQRF